MAYPSSVAYLLIAKQSDFTTSATPSQDLGLIHSSITPGETIEVKQTQGIGGLETEQITDGVRKPTLKTEGEFQHGRMLTYLFGTVTHVQTTSDWKHTFTTLDEAVYASIEVGFSLSAGDVVETYTGMTVSTATFKGALNEPVTLSLDWEGYDQSTPGTSASTAVTSTLPIFPHQSVTVTVNSVSAPQVQEWSVTFTRDPTDAGGMGSLTRTALQPSKMQVEWEMTLGFTDTTYHALTVSRTVFPLVIEGTNGTALGSGQRLFHLGLKNCLTTEPSEQISLSGLVFLTMKGVGLIDSIYTVDNISDTAW